MYCYNCGCQLSEHNFCTACGADVSVYKKIMALSNRFYNAGLEKAGVRDLSGAVNSLRQSLKFNKNNIEARNLLGLVYFEMGEVVAALSEWVISKNMRPQKNIADDYIERLQSNQTRLDSLNQTIKKYNQSLLYCMQDSKDLAVIQLKKVLSMNPKFMRAHLLLALLYIDSEDWNRAERELRRCQQIDTGNVMVKRYMQEVDKMLHPEEVDNPKKRKKKEEKKPEEVFRYTSGNETIIQPLDVKEPKGVGFSSLAYIGIGLAIGVAIAMFLVLPARIQTAKADANNQLKTVSEQLSTKSAAMEELQQQVDTLSAENTNLHSQLDAYVGNDGTLQTMDDMMSAVKVYMETPEDYQTIATYLETISTETTIEETSAAFQAVYSSLLEIVGPSVATKYYADGLDSYKKEMYPEAITNLEKAYMYNTQDVDIIYNLANAYYKNGDLANAQTYYQKVVDDFPSTDRSRKSQQYLDEIAASAG